MLVTYWTDNIDDIFGSLDYFVDVSIHIFILKQTFIINFFCAFVVIVTLER